MDLIPVFLVSKCPIGRGLFVPIPQRQHTARIPPRQIRELSRKQAAFLLTPARERNKVGLLCSF